MYENNYNRVAIITGASSGIGKATLEVLVNEGKLIIANARRKHKLNELELKYNIGKKSVYTVQGDISDDSVIEELLKTSSMISNSPPSIFVLCAGHGLPGSILTSDSTKWKNLFETNCWASIKQLRAVVNKMLDFIKQNNDQKAYDIVVIGSTIGRTLSVFNPVYGATKFALHSLVESLRQEICNNFIRVTLIEPGFVSTEFQEVSGYDKEWFSDVEKSIGPILHPEDIAKTISFVINQPRHIHIDNIRIRPTRQKV